MRSVLVRFRVGSFGGIRGPTMEETIEVLRLHGFPKELDGEVKKRLESLRSHRGNKNFPIEDVEQDFFELLRKWQRKKKKGEKNVVSASK
ncbi:MAG: hypothetical protein V3T98_01245 [Candidatus Paceibacterota bacterium]